MNLSSYQRMTPWVGRLIIANAVVLLLLMTVLTSPELRGALEFVPGRELTVGVLEGRALAVGEIIPRHEIFDYECKYTPGMSEEIFPADLPEAVTEECRRLGLLAHEALKLVSAMAKAKQA